MAESNVTGRPKRRRTIQDYSLFVKKQKRPKKVPKQTATSFTDREMSELPNASIVVKEVPTINADQSELHSSFKIEVKQELDDSSLDEDSPEDSVNVTTTEAVVKEELIIEDSSDVQNDNPKLDKRSFRKFMCKICRKSLTSKLELEQHAREIHKMSPDQMDLADGMRKCPLCDFSSYSYDDYKKHAQEHREPESGQWRCTDCDRLFTKRVFLMKHMELKACESVKKPKKTSTKTAKTFICAECNKTYIDRSKFLKHVKKHLPENKHLCEICGTSIFSKEALAKHMQMHAKRHPHVLPTKAPELFVEGEDGLIQCSECPEKFPSREEYIAHYKWRMYLKQLDLKCNICGEYYEFPSPLQEHEKWCIKKQKPLITAIPADNGTFHCSACNQTFVSQYTCAKHIRTAHPSDFRCKTCGKFWDTAEQLQKHEKKHANNLANSIVVETNENGLFMCNECPMAFPLRTRCVSHIKRHQQKRVEDGEEPVPVEVNAPKSTDFKCDECGKFFSSRVSLVSHRWRHQNVKEKRFQCQKCEQNFETRTQFTSHMLTHAFHRENPNRPTFECSECGSSFFKWNSFSAHTKWHLRCKQNLAQQGTESQESVPPEYAAELEELEESAPPDNAAELEETCPTELISPTPSSHEAEEITDQEAEVILPDCDTEQPEANLTEQKPPVQTLSCSVCKSDFPDPSSYASHIRTCSIVLERNVNGLFECNKCPMSFSNRIMCVKHIQGHERISAKQVEQPAPVKEEVVESCDAIVKEELIIEDDFEPAEVMEAKEEEELESIELKVEPQSDQALTCKICQTQLSTMQQLVHHARTIHQQSVDQIELDAGLRKCPFCDFCAYENDAFRTHLQKHRNKESGTWRCVYCGKCYLNREDLKTHAKLTNCKNSMKRKLKRLERANAIVVKTDENGSFKCNKCPAVFPFRSKCLAHITRHEKPKGMYDCADCDKTYSTAHTLATHVQWHKKRESYRFTCKGCQKVFYRQRYLDKHNIAKNCGLDQGSEIIPPDNAMEQFVNYLNEPRIRRIHDKDGKFRCSGCNKTFTCQYTCTRHIRLYHPSNYRCDTCGMFWPSELQLREHEKKHANLLAKKIVLDTDASGLFKCNECPMLFSHRGACIYHIAHHTKRGTKKTKPAE